MFEVDHVYDTHVVSNHPLTVEFSTLETTTVDSCSIFNMVKPPWTAMIVVNRL